MRKVRLGKSGLEVTKIGFGGIPIQRLSHDEAVELVAYAFEQGMNWIDTANFYGTSEERIGQALERIDRGRVLVFTKGGGDTVETIGEQIDHSLDKLGIEAIDLYQMHNVSEIEHWEKLRSSGVVDYLEELKSEGVIRHIGASSHQAPAMLEVMADERIEVVQFPFNFVVYEDALDVLELCIERDIGFIAMKPFGGGLLDDARACIGFLKEYPQAAVNPGFEAKEQVDEVIHICREPHAMTPRLWKTIERITSEVGRKFCRRCGYCEPCPHGVSISSLMTVEMMGKRFELKGLLEGGMQKLVDTIEKCETCGQCEQRCPYHLPIRERIRESAQWFRELSQIHDPDSDD